jgi:hypothetical protein
MQKPVDALVASIANTLDANLREAFEERAGIMQYDGKLSQGHAECLALLDVLHRHPAVHVLQAELDGVTQWVVTTNLTYARRHLQDMGGIELDVLNLAEVIEEQYGGMAMLATVG